MSQNRRQNGREIQLLPIRNTSIASNASFVLTTISWQQNAIHFYHEVIAYSFLFLCIIGFATVIFLAFVYMHIVYIIIGVIGIIFVTLLCFLYYIRHCFGLCFEIENKLTFNETDETVEIHRNGTFIQAIAFDAFDTVSYENRCVYLHLRQQQNQQNDDILIANMNPVPLNVYQCDPDDGRQFVLTVTEIWQLIKGKANNLDFEPISLHS